MLLLQAIVQEGLLW